MRDVFKAISSDSPITLENIDNERKESLAYRYLVSLSEAQLWLEKILGKKYNGVKDFERQLQTGIDLCLLAQIYSPDSIKRVYYGKKNKTLEHEKKRYNAPKTINNQELVDINKLIIGNQINNNIMTNNKLNSANLTIDSKDVCNNLIAIHSANSEENLNIENKDICDEELDVSLSNIKVSTEELDLDYRYTDNICFFLDSLKSISMPNVCIFETINLYELKNFPSVIFCLHALSHYLVFKGYINQEMSLKNVDKITFTKKELEEKEQEIIEWEKRGLTIPKFENVKNVLFDDAIEVINYAILNLLDRKQVETSKKQKEAIEREYIKNILDEINKKNLEMEMKIEAKKKSYFEKKYLKIRIYDILKNFSEKKGKNIIRTYMKTYLYSKTCDSLFSESKCSRLSFFSLKFYSPLFYKNGEELIKEQKINHLSKLTDHKRIQIYVIENYIDELEIRIGLLLNNQVNLKNLTIHRLKIDDFINVNIDLSDYCYLFNTIQVDPVWIFNLIKHADKNDIDEIFMKFFNASKHNEKYLYNIVKFCFDNLQHYLLNKKMASIKQALFNYEKESIEIIAQFEKHCAISIKEKLKNDELKKFNLSENLKYEECNEKNEKICDFKIKDKLSKSYETCYQTLINLFGNSEHKKSVEFFIYNSAKNSGTEAKNEDFVDFDYENGGSNVDNDKKDSCFDRLCRKNYFVIFSNLNRILSNFLKTYDNEYKKAIFRFVESLNSVELEYVPAVILKNEWKQETTNEKALENDTVFNMYVNRLKNIKNEVSNVLDVLNAYTTYLPFTIKYFFKRIHDLFESDNVLKDSSINLMARIQKILYNHYKTVLRKYENTNSFTSIENMIKQESTHYSSAEDKSIKSFNVANSNQYFDFNEDGCDLTDEKNVNIVLNTEKLSFKNTLIECQHDHNTKSDTLDKSFNEKNQNNANRVIHQNEQNSISILKSVFTEHFVNPYILAPDIFFGCEITPKYRRKLQIIVEAITALTKNHFDDYLKPLSGFFDSSKRKIKSIISNIIDINEKSSDLYSFDKMVFDKPYVLFSAKSANKCINLLNKTIQYENSYSTCVNESEIDKIVLNTIKSQYIPLKKDGNIDLNVKNSLDLTSLDELKGKKADGHVLYDQIETKDNFESIDSLLLSYCCNLYSFKQCIDSSNIKNVHNYEEVLQRISSIVRISDSNRLITFYLNKPVFKSRKNKELIDFVNKTKMRIINLLLLASGHCLFDLVTKPPTQEENDRYQLMIYTVKALMNGNESQVNTIMDYKKNQKIGSLSLENTTDNVAEDMTSILKHDEKISFESEIINKTSNVADKMCLENTVNILHEPDIVENVTNSDNLIKDSVLMDSNNPNKNKSSLLELNAKIHADSGSIDFLSKKETGILNDNDRKFQLDSKMNKITYPNSIMDNNWNHKVEDFKVFLKSSGGFTYLFDFYNQKDVYSDADNNKIYKIFMDKNNFFYETLESFKNAILDDLSALEDAKVTFKKNNYAELIEALLNDIIVINLKAHERENMLKQMKKVYTDLALKKEKLEHRMKANEDYLASYAAKLIRKRKNVSNKKSNYGSFKISANEMMRKNILSRFISHSDICDYSNSNTIDNLNASEVEKKSSSKYLSKNCETETYISKNTQNTRLNSSKVDSIDTSSINSKGTLDDQCQNETRYNHINPTNTAENENINNKKNISSIDLNQMAADIFFIFMCEIPGEFIVEMYLNSSKLDGSFAFRLDELLKIQYQGRTDFKVNGVCIFKISGLISLINKKFID
ncbi:hypothetical protein EDEG_00557 [Edhazardia aedis USNM 41457]|uniref:Calponin-homology (CH) domain-containing protein n=1 Tax=Edhazardia aedis (strain USNM 41457) TaxID=1003232 RepID=J9D0X2_EDHAE|nr:hypothetical protein EDEG_00557 [Edhazardia aedis USNM 41457]|eukprot:EJW01224.1 hypothetical protein EDEG_00557 [Edhazardia aedis USNM 41457]